MRGVIIRHPHSLSSSEQLSLNGRALLRDLAHRDFRKLKFHLRGFCRALVTF